MLTVHVCNLDKQLHSAGQSQLALIDSLEALTKGKPPLLAVVSPSVREPVLLRRGSGAFRVTADMQRLGDKVSGGRIALQAHKLVSLGPRIAAAEQRLQAIEARLPCFASDARSLPSTFRVNAVRCWRILTSLGLDDVDCGPRVMGNISADATGSLAANCTAY